MKQSLEALLQSYIDSYFLENPQELVQQDGGVEGQEREYYGYEDQIQEHEEEYEEEDGHHHHHHMQQSQEEEEEGYY